MSKANKPITVHLERSLESVSSKIAAIKALSSVHSVEKERLNNGFKWMANDEGAKLVSPKRIKLLLNRGYRIVDPIGLSC